MVKLGAVFRIMKASCSKGLCLRKNIDSSWCLKMGIVSYLRDHCVRHEEFFSCWLIELQLILRFLFALSFPIKWFLKSLFESSRYFDSTCFTRTLAVKFLLCYQSLNWSFWWISFCISIKKIEEICVGIVEHMISLVLYFLGYFAIHSIVK